RRFSQRSWRSPCRPHTRGSTVRAKTGFGYGFPAALLAHAVARGGGLHRGMEEDGEEPAVDRATPLEIEAERNPQQCDAQEGEQGRPRAIDGLGHERHPL